MSLIHSFDDCRIAAEIMGAADAPPIILSHYLGGSKESWDQQIATLSNSFRVLSFDTRGQGESEASPGPYSVEMLAKDALAVMDAFSLDSVDFIGLSQGGMVGMWLAIHYPKRINRLVLANTTPFIPNKDIWDQLSAKALNEGMAAIAETTILGWLSEGFKEANPDQVQLAVDTMAAMSPAGYAANCPVLRDIDLRSELEKITCPTLVIAGVEDGPRGASAPIVASTVTDGRLVTIPGAAHLSHIENPPAFNAALSEFLQ